MPDSGTTSLNFGAFPGSTDVSLDVATTGVITTSRVEAWLQPKATAEHNVDEHLVEEVKVSGYYKSDGVITIYGCFDGGPPLERKDAAGKLYGNFNVGWVWV